jgi:hypothetical protein
LSQCYGTGECQQSEKWKFWIPEHGDNLLNDIKFKIPRCKDVSLHRYTVFTLFPDLTEEAFQKAGLLVHFCNPNYSGGGNWECPG